MAKHVLPSGFRSWFQVYLKTIADLDRHGMEYNDETVLEWTRLSYEFGPPLEFSELPEGITIKDLKAMSFDEIVAAIPEERALFDALHGDAGRYETRAKLIPFTAIVRTYWSMR